MAFTMTQKIWDGYDERTRDRLRSAGITEFDPPVFAPRPAYVAQTLTPVKVVRNGGVTQYVAGMIVIGFGAIIHLTGTGITALGAWLVRTGYHMRDR